MYYRYFLKQGALFDTRSKEIEQLIVRINSVFNAYFTKFSTLVMKQEDNQVRNYVFILKLKEQNKRTTNGREIFPLSECFNFENRPTVTLPISVYKLLNAVAFKNGALGASEPLSSTQQRITVALKEIII